MDAIKSITTTEDEFNELLSNDVLYIILGRLPDDNDLQINDILELAEEYQYLSKLRGPHDGPYSVANDKNNHDYFHGYVVGIPKTISETFDRKLVLYSIKSGYYAKKIDVSEYKTRIAENLKASKDKLFANLFEEN